MSQDTNISEDRIQQMLAEAAEMDLAFARHVHGLALASEDVEVVADLGRTQARLTRSLRQNLALIAKLQREADLDARSAEQAARREARLNPPPQPPGQPRRMFPRDIPAADHRAAEIRTAVRRVIWAEGLEKSDYETECELEPAFVRILEDWLADDRLADDFTERPLDAQVEEFCRTFDLNPANVARWRELEDPDPGDIEAWLAESALDDPPIWRASG